MGAIRLWQSLQIGMLSPIDAYGFAPVGAILWPSIDAPALERETTTIRAGEQK
jgi:hypothetical protein